MTKSSTKIIFFGTSGFAVPALEALKKDSYEIIAVITNPDEPTGRKKTLTPPPVKVIADKLGLKIYQPEKLRNNLGFAEELKKLNCDLGVVAAYGKIIPKEILDLPRFGLINIHPSLLPKYRGPTPVQTTILNGEKETGVTLIKVDEETDHGPVMATSDKRLATSKKYEELHNELAKIGAELLINTLPKYLNGNITMQEQDHLQATFTKKFTREEARINWNKTAEEINNQIHALNPEPGTWTMWDGKILKILEIDTRIADSSGAARQGEPPQRAGSVSVENDTVLVKTANSNVFLKTIQLEGKKVVSAKDFARGNQKFIGAILN